MSSAHLSSVQDGIYELGKAHMCSTPSLRSFPDVAFETIPMLFWLTIGDGRNVHNESYINTVVFCCQFSLSCFILVNKGGKDVPFGTEWNNISFSAIRNRHYLFYGSNCRTLCIIIWVSYLISQLLLLLLLQLPAVTATNTVITNAVAAVTFTRTNTTTGNASSATTKSNCRQIVPLASNKYTEKQAIYNYLTRTNDTIRERERQRQRQTETDRQRHRERQR